MGKLYNIYKYLDNLIMPSDLEDAGLQAELASKSQPEEKPAELGFQKEQEGEKKEDQEHEEKHKEQTIESDNLTIEEETCIDESCIIFKDTTRFLEDEVSGHYAATGNLLKISEHESADVLESNFEYAQTVLETIKQNTEILRSLAKDMQTTIEKLQVFSLKNSSDLRNFVNQLTDWSKKVKHYTELYYNVLKLRKEYKQACLNGRSLLCSKYDLQDTRQIFSERTKLDREIQASRKAWLGLGKFFNRGKISVLKDQLAARQKDEKQIPSDLNLPSEEYNLREFIRRTLPTAQENFKAKLERFFYQEIPVIKEDLSEQNKLYYASSPEEDLKQPVESQAVADLVESLAGDFFDKEDWFNSMPKDMPGQKKEVRQRLIELARETRGIDPSYGSSNDPRYKEASRFLEQTGHQISYEIERAVFGLPAWRRVFKLLHFPDFLKAQDKYDAAKLKAEQAENRFQDNHIDANGIHHFLQINRDLSYYEDPLRDFPFHLWNLVKNNPKFVEMAGGQKKIEEADKCLLNRIRQRVLTTREHSDTSIKNGSALLEYGGQENIILNVLNAWREVGHSGEHPFLSGNSMYEAPIIKFLKSQSQADIEAVKQKHPSVGRIIDKILQHPNDFNESTKRRRNEETGEFEYTKNPIREQIISDYRLASIDMLASLNEDEQFFALGCLKRAGSEDFSEEVFDRLDAILSQSNNQKLTDEIVEMILSRLSGFGDPRAIKFLGDNFHKNFNTKHKNSVYERRASILNRVFVSDFSSDVLESVAKIFDLIAGELPRLKSAYYKIFQRANEPSYFSIADQNVKKLLNFIKSHSDSELEVIYSQMEKVRRFSPDFCFNSYLDLKENGELLDAFEVMANRSVDDVSSLKNILKQLAKYLEGQTEKKLPLEYIKPFLKAYRQSDPILQDTEAKKGEISPEILDRFNESFSVFVQIVMSDETNLIKRAFFVNRNCLRYLARQPEKVQTIVNYFNSDSKIFELCAPGGVLHTNLDNVVKDVFSNGDFVARANVIESIFTEKIPYWQQLVFFTEARLGDQLAESASPAPVDGVNGRKWQEIIATHKQIKDQDPQAPTDLETFVADVQVRRQLLEAEIASAPFASLHGVTKRLVYAERIRDSVELSRDQSAKSAADKRNRVSAVEQLVFDKKMAAHGTEIEALDPILFQGNIPRESLGATAGADSFAFHFDFWTLGPGYGKENELQDLESFYTATSIDRYASKSKGVVLIYDRSQPDCYQFGNEIPGKIQGEHHGVILGGMPSSEVSALVIRDNDLAAKVKNKVVENGFYIPVYDETGRLIFSEQEYDQIYQDRNVSVPVEIWDSSFKTTDKLGSNPGGTYVVPTEDGPTKFYVKFDLTDDADKVWNEQLADNIYRLLKLRVPDTRVVKIGRQYGHASKWDQVETAENATDFKDGFLADCLLSNWDVIFDRNRGSIDGQTTRMDNGGALLFRARGERRNFSGMVMELNTMRNSYKGLTDFDINSQIDNLRRLFTDQAIDKVVDSVRLSQADRNYLKDILRQRRDYIINYYNQDSKEKFTEQEIPEAGQEIYNMIITQEIDDEALSVIVPEWEKINGPNGYQHNKVLLGKHIKDALGFLKSQEEFIGLTDREKNLAAMAMFFHDFEKPTDSYQVKIERDFEHETPSAQTAAQYMGQWGYGPSEIRVVVDAIMNDGIVSDIARDKVRDKNKQLTPQELKENLGGNESTLQILRLINQADVLATVGQSGFDRIANKYNEFFNQALVGKD
ncbi:MAG: hypothetical protein COU31_00545 [Candidatus Magasanikbacteria bacterium CG10_big_fil_rev_8_21_14_0_10_40_10]|uniref:HD domain-containing protein n=1 Tax=Candidatus Magasanikbacteria bacterium CG10_big_fil_rev_8_21_14_0_10_40_10 TaxID=1974648 RepID=A0A2M6W581_9BACT|nr:MAG: hypothetical protein COU31_00545 [Candidatus Magasanikbacteria bacterium CG10_big_fil_rev_8_21_14_0_10_40_10]